MPYSLLMLWRDRRRFLPAVLAVTFSAVLIAIQCGLLFGLLLCSSVPVDASSADIWITTRDAPALAQAHPIPKAWILRAAGMPEVTRTEEYLLAPVTCHKPAQGSTELCLIVGARMDEGSLGAFGHLSPELRTRLTEPGTVVVDEWDFHNLGLKKGINEFIEINDRRVRVVGTVSGHQGINFAWIFSSLQTAEMVMPQLSQRPDLTMFGLVKCRNPEDADRVAQRLRSAYPEMGVHTKQEFSGDVRLYWLIRSKGGTVMLCTVVLALLVGLVVTSQTLYGSVLASLREYAVLDALGIPRQRLVGLVLAKSFWVGLSGVLFSVPIVIVLSWAALLIRTHIHLAGWLLPATGAATLGMALLSGVSALRSLRHVEPATLLR